MKEGIEDLDAHDCAMIGGRALMLASGIAYCAFAPVTAGTSVLPGLALIGTAIAPSLHWPHIPEHIVPHGVPHGPRDKVD